jgi:hypoxanthine phosphoribosyltransferase
MKTTKEQVMDKTIESLVKNAPLAIVVIGVLLFVIGAAGGLPVGDPPLQVGDPAWRIGLAAMGILLAGVGVLSMLRAPQEDPGWMSSRGLEKQIEALSKDAIPISIKRSVSYSQLYKGLERINGILDETRFKPEVIVCVHYMGTAFGAILGHIMFKPIYTAVVQYGANRDRVKCERVSLPFQADRILRGKKVLIVDNSIHTGRTLKMVREEVEKHTSEVRTFVIHERASAVDAEITPDYVLFRSEKLVRFLA